MFYTDLRHSGESCSTHFCINEGGGKCRAVSLYMFSSGAAVTTSTSCSMSVERVKGVCELAPVREKSWERCQFQSSSRAKPLECV